MAKLSDIRLKQIWCILNKREMPKEFRGLIPLTDEQRRGIMVFIEILVGKTECQQEYKNNERG